MVKRHGGPRSLGDALASLGALGITVPELPADREDGSPPFRIEPEVATPRVVSREVLESKEYGWRKRALDEALEANPRKSAISQLDARGDAEGIVILSGIPGCGKTVAAAWWALNAPRASKFITAAEFARSSRYIAEDRDALFSHRRLVLDDLGSEYADAKGSFSVDLDELVDMFYSDRRRLVITTNLDAASFKARYGARVVDRLAECGEWIRVTDRSLRRREA